MKSDELISNSRAIAIGLLELCQRKGATGDEITAMATNALIEVLGQRLGGIFPVVERLRDLADICECQALAESQGGGAQ